MATTSQLTPERKLELQQMINNMPGAGQDMLRRMLTGKGYAEGTIEKPNVIDKLAYGYDKSPYTIQKIGAWSQDKLKEYLIARKIEEDKDKELAELIRTDPNFYAATAKNVEEVHDRWRDQYGMNMAQLKYATDKHVKETYPAIWGSHMEDDLSTIAGNIAKFVADPTTLIPLTQGWKAASLVGGAVVAYDTAFNQLYERGEIDGQELFLFSALGAIAAPIIVWGGRRLSHWVSGKIRKGETVTEEELKQVFLLEKDPHSTINVPPTAGQTGVERGAGRLLTDETKLGGLNKMSAEDMISIVEKEVHAGRMTPGEAAALRREWGIDEVVPKGGHIGPQKRIEQQKRLAAPEWEVDQRMKGVNFKQLASEINRVSHESKIRPPGPPTRKQFDELASAYKSMEKVIEPPVRNPKTGRFESANAPRRDPVTGRMRVGKDKRNYYTMPSLKSLFQGFTAKQAEALRIKSGKKYLRKEVEDMHQLRGKEIEVLTARMNRSEAEHKALIKAMKERITPDTVMKLLNGAGQGGYAEGLLLQHISGGLAGGLAGLYLGDAEMAFLGMIAGGFAPIWIPKLWGGVGRLDETFLSKKWRMNAESAKHYTSPETFIRAIPGIGDKVADRLHEFGIYKTRIQSLSLHAVENLIRQIPEGSIPHFIGAMQTGVMTGDKVVDKAVVKTQTMFKNFARMARAHKIINAGKFQAMMDAKYWPRIYNQPFLETKEGRDMFINLLTKEGFKQKGQGERILGSLLRAEEKHVPQFKMRKNKAGEVTYILDKKAADRVMLRRMKVSMSKRSTHMDYERKLKVSDETVLQRFMIQDPLTVITEYGHDVATRLSAARNFGPNEEVIKILANSNWGKNPANARDLDYILDTFYTALGDSRAASVAKQINISDKSRHVLGSINSFETLKLSLAQILNMTQATVNGMTFASKHGAGTAIKTYAKGLRDVFSKEGQDFAARSGAALETTIMSMITEHSANATVLGMFGKGEFKGAMSWLNTLNNPSKFLKNTGFMDIEMFQRKLAANQGKALFEEAMEHYAAATSGKLAGPQAKSMKKKAIRIAKDLGMSEDQLVARSPEQAMASLEIAGLEFSNRINHTNNFDRLPASWRGPYARVALKFKSFMFHQGAFIKDNVLAPAHMFMKTGGKDGSLTPIAAYVGVGTPMGMTSDQIRRMLAQDDRELTMTGRMLRGISAVGAAGLWLDSAVLFTTNPYAGSAFGLMGGPALSSLFGASRAVTDAALGMTGKPVVRQAIKDVGGGVPGKRFLIDMFRNKTPMNLEAIYGNQ